MIQKLKETIENAKSIVFFGGAGVSTESGIPDFRSADGLYNESGNYPPETILSYTFFISRTEDFYKFYRSKMIFPNAKPNAAHLKLAQWENEGKLRAVVTQNIDGLHSAAGSKNVFELHGSVYRNYCMDCHKFFGLPAVMSGDGIPKCDACGGTIKPDVVLYEEALDEKVIEGAVKAIRAADVFIIGGTSLNVYPAAGLANYYKGSKLIIINKSALADRAAYISISDGIAKVLSQV